MREKEQPVPTFKHCNSFGRNCLKHVVLIKSMYQSSINPEPEIYENPCEERSQTTNYCRGVCSMMPRHGDKVLKSSGLSQLSLLQRERTIQLKAHAPEGPLRNGIQGLER